MSLWTKIFGDPNKRFLATMTPAIEKINAFEASLKPLSDAELLRKTTEFRELLAHGKKLDDLLPEAFACVREASRRTLNQRHYDVQLIGGIVLHKGQIAEMRTGEGKTLTATLPIYLNALEGRGVHLVTVNEYLAKRDAVMMGQIYHALGLSIGVIGHQSSWIYDPGFVDEPKEDEKRDATGTFRVDMKYLRPCSRAEAYRVDITYGTNNEFGFDYLRDNMVGETERMSQRPLHFAIVDEVDSILIDEARTPLIISAPAQDSSDMYAKFSQIARQMDAKTDYTIDEKMRSVSITADGIARVEKILGIENLYVHGGIAMVHHMEQALRAEALYKRDVEYVVKDNEIIIVDEFTGRMLPGRRYSEGLHQAIEAKEGVKVQQESMTLATVTFQNYFRMYKKLAGMTGTAATEAEEFAKIYKLEVTTVPTNKPMVRADYNDKIFKSVNGKFLAVARDIKERHEKGQPVLVGTISIEKNELLGALLEREGIKFNLLNAKNHEKEAEYIAQAGRKGAVTIATNMAGRGVDIILGGNPQDPREAEEVRAAGGLCVIGTERHESRRIDNQLRGRAGRQGDPGESVFYVSLEDDLMRIFMSDRVRKFMNAIGLPEDMPIEQKMVTNGLEQAQKKVEGNNFDIRKHLLEYDDVLNKHREVLYGRRRRILEVAEGREKVEGTSDKTKTLRDLILELTEGELEQMVLFHTSAEDPHDWKLAEVYEAASAMLPMVPEEKMRIESFREGKFGIAEARTKIIAHLMAHASGLYDSLEKRILDPNIMHAVEKEMLLRAIDTLWIEHLQSMDHLRASIGLRGYGQHDPLVEYKREAYRMFNELLVLIQKQVVYSFFKIDSAVTTKPSVMETTAAVESGPAKDAESVAANSSGVIPESRNPEKYKDVGRNDACPCKSGLKYKKCHGK
ncbi:MAG: preprotein translocase subunit SecA [bacterium]